MAIDSAELDNQLTRQDRALLFRKLGIEIPSNKADTDGWINGLKLPPSIHDDTNASVSVNLSNGGIIDHGGHFSGDLFKLAQIILDCSFPEALEWVARKVGHSAEQTAPRSGSSERLKPPTIRWDPIKDGRVVAVYEYTDEHGIPLFEVVRIEVQPDHQAYPDKTFRLRLPGASKYGIGETQRVIYRLPHVKEAVRKGNIVYIVEGEKDADALEGWDLVATTSPMGAGKWLNEYADDLHGADVVIIPDNDAAGKTHAKAIAKSLARVAGSIRIVRLPGLPSKGDVSDWIAAGGTPDELQQLVSGTEPYRASIIFWFRDKKQNIRIDQNAFIRFLESRGFGKIYLPGELRSRFVRQEDNIIEEFSTETVKDFTLAYIGALSGTELDDDEVDAVRGALIRGASIYFGKGVLECLQPLQPTFKRHNRDQAFFFYENGFVRVTQDDVELMEYDVLGGVIWKKEIRTRTFTPSEDADEDRLLESEFGRFLWNVCTDPDETRHCERFKALLSAIGYLLHRHKNRSTAKAIVFVDERISDIPNGRTGKSLVGNALRHMIPTSRIDGRNFKFDSRFAFQSVKLDTAVVEFNDVPKKFDFERLYSVITDSMMIEKKNRDQFILPFEASPKFLVSTNYIIEGEGGSHEDRIFEIEFSDYYNARHKPVDDFGGYLFEDWDADEWNRFDHVLLYCVQVYLRHGLHTYTHVNLTERKLRQQTAPEFLEFMRDFELGVIHNKKTLHERFVNAFPDFAKIQQRTLTSWCKKYAKAYGLVVTENRGTGGTERSIMLTRQESVTQDDAE